jgi:hypothetical protein
MIKLYRSSIHPKQWIAQVEGKGWVMFPAKENGWESRQPARGLDPMFLREVPVQLAESAGIPILEYVDAA